MSISIGWRSSIGWRWWRCEILWNSMAQGAQGKYFRHVRWYIVVLSFQGTCRMQKKNTHTYIYIILYRLFHNLILYSYINIYKYNIMCMYLDKRGKGWLCVCMLLCIYEYTYGLQYTCTYVYVRTYPQNYVPTCSMYRIGAYSWSILGVNG